MRRFVAYGPSLIVLFTAALTLLAGPQAIRQIQAARTAATVTVAQQRLDGDDLLERLNQSVRDIAATVEPAVVYIRAEMQGRRGVSTGSGWVYNDRGHIVTNSHVVAGADKIEVNFHDGHVRTASFVGMDASTDIAIIKVDADAALLFPARRATDRPLYQGDAVFAFGSPFGFKFSMSQGIVSGLGRDASTGSGPGTTIYSNFIQTDAAINPGNSGGPLVDVKGRVVGMNTAIIAEGGGEDEEDPPRSGRGMRRREVSTGSLGIGFAIPLETIESVVDQLIEKGVVLKGYLGVSLGDLEGPNAARALELGYTGGSGVMVKQVIRDQPAAKAGLKPFDIITQINGRATPNMTVLRSIISNRKPDATVKVTIWRDGKTQDRDVTLMAAMVNAAGDPVPVDHEWVVAEAARQQAYARVARSLAAYGVSALDEGPNGVLIGAVQAGSAAFASGLRAGQQITRVFDRPVTTRDDLFEALQPLLRSDGPGEAAAVVIDLAGSEHEARLVIEP